MRRPGRSPAPGRVIAVSCFGDRDRRDGAGRAVVPSRYVWVAFPALVTGSSVPAFLSSARSSSRSCAAITCTNEPLRVTATQAEPGSTCSISHLWPYSWNNPASLPEPADPPASWRSLTSCSVLPRSHQTRLRHDHLPRLAWPTRRVTAHCADVNYARGAESPTNGFNTSMTSSSHDDQRVSSTVRRVPRSEWMADKELTVGCHRTVGAACRHLR